MWNHEYFHWLLEQVSARPTLKGRMKLYHKLHNTEFLWCLDNDRRRAKDGIALREKFYKFDQMTALEKRQNCSVLEMLVAFAIRIDNEWIGTPGTPRPYIIFNDMVGNLLKVNHPDLDMVIDDWMHRRFDYNGYGSIFPLRDPDCDQRDIEIWSQMLRYIKENY